jgi:AAA domain
VAGQPRPVRHQASSAAAVATRQPKDHGESEESVHVRWTAELAEQGVGERQLAAVCSGGRGRPASRTELDAALDALAGPDGLTGQVSTFTRTDVVDALAKRLPVAPSAQEARSQIEAAADRFLAERAVRVRRDSRLGVERFSTPELLALERQLVDSAIERTGEGRAVVRPEVVRQVLDRHSRAGEDQAAMVRDLTQGGDGVAVVVGRAGSGKTWALGLAREAFELDGYQVLGAAPTGIATVGLAEEGFTDALTVDRLLFDLQRGRTELDDRTCWWWTRPPWSPPASSPLSLSMPTVAAPRWCWSATTASSLPSPPAAASAPSDCAWAPAS